VPRRGQKRKKKEKATVKKLVEWLVGDLEQYMNQGLDAGTLFNLGLLPGENVPDVYDDWGSGWGLCERFKIGEELCPQFLEHIVNLLDVNVKIVLTYDPSKIPLIKELARLYKEGKPEEEIDEWIKQVHTATP